MWRESKAALDRHLADEALEPACGTARCDMVTGARTASEFGALHAFLPGVLALAATSTGARRLQQSAFAMWQLHGIEPEVLDYRAMKVVHPGYKLRPEIVESAYVLYRRPATRAISEMGRTFLAPSSAHCRARTATR
jgi:mannosidase alpha-like ER degradation enhancer 2